MKQQVDKFAVVPKTDVAFAALDIIEKLSVAGFTIQKVNFDTFNVISNKTGAVLERLVSMKGLTDYMRCIDYIINRHGVDIARFTYTTPVHN